jgi:ATP-binding cassette subfamily B protein
MSTLLRRVRLWLVLGLAAAPWLAAVGLAISVAAAVLAPLATLGVGRVVDGLGAGDTDRVTSGLWLVGAGIVVAVLQSCSRCRGRSCGSSSRTSGSAMPTTTCYAS